MVRMKLISDENDEHKENAESNENVENEFKGR